MLWNDNINLSQKLAFATIRQYELITSSGPKCQRTLQSHFTFTTALRFPKTALSYLSVPTRIIYFVDPPPCVYHRANYMCVITGNLESVALRSYSLLIPLYISLSPFTLFFFLSLYVFISSFIFIYVKRLFFNEHFLRFASLFLPSRREFRHSTLKVISTITIFQAARWELQLTSVFSRLLYRLAQHTRRRAYTREHPRPVPVPIAYTDVYVKTHFRGR